MNSFIRHSLRLKAEKRGPRQNRRPKFESMRSAGFVPSFGVRSLGVRVFYKAPLLQPESRFFEI